MNAARRLVAALWPHIWPPVIMLAGVAAIWGEQPVIAHSVVCALGIYAWCVEPERARKPSPPPAREHSRHAVVIEFQAVGAEDAMATIDRLRQQTQALADEWARTVEAVGRREGAP